MFGKEFVWGVSAAAYQIEGAWKEDGKSESIWDMFCRKEGAVYRGQSGDVACDHYHRYKEDVAIMKELGVKAYRMSISWPRILPDGIGEVNPKGIEFYDHLIDELLANGIVPYITLFHWDMPMAIYRRGGLLNPEFADWFTYYATVVVKHFGDRVKWYMTFNEPTCFMGGFVNGETNAPGLKMSLSETIPMAHHLLLAHGRAFRAMKQCGYDDIQVGIAQQGLFYYPETECEEDIEAARYRTMDLMPDPWYRSVSWWSDPILLGNYPEDGLRTYGTYLPKHWEADMEEIHSSVDFFAQNYYGGEMYSWKKGAVVPKPGSPRNTAGWDITPEGMKWAVKFLYERYQKPIIISENGMPCHDWVATDGKVHDPNRIDFIKRYVRSLWEAMEEGVPVLGYFYWSILDNFEWTLGYSERFGLVYVDFETQERVIKDSGYWYRKVIESEGKEVFLD